MSSIMLMFADLFALTVALGLAFGLRYDKISFAFFAQQLPPHHQSLLVALVLFPFLFLAFRLYRYAWRFASIEIIGKIIAAITLGVLGWYAANLLLDKTPVTRSVYAIFWLLSVAMVGGIRICLRMTSAKRRHWRHFFELLLRRVQHETTRVVILGANPDGVRLQRALTETSNTSYTIVGFLDDSSERHGMYLHGVRVLGPLQQLYDLLAESAVDQVLIALPRGEAIREYVLACRRQQIPVKIIPQLADVLHGNMYRQLEDISVEDLLRRPPVQTDLSDIGGYLTGKRVLVTGAGGSIGSELCRQIANFGPSQLILLGHGENSIHNIHQELIRRVPEIADRIKMVIASVTDVVRIEQTFKKFSPQIVFHAAAHKHVPIMEDNLPEAIQNNIFGTHCVAQACGRHGIERMVLISTDKAVYPSSVMGATKWFCEEVVCGQAEIYPTTTYVSVRFGNVLGSRGSVVPIFKAQIRRGGPVTVTHPDMTRYFMTIPEAVQLVLQTGAIGENGQLYLLDMGEPVKIVDLARDMITLCGLIPEVDIPIMFTGLRPGEKLHEQLVMDPARLNPAKRSGMSVIERTPAFTAHELAMTLQQFSLQTKQGNQEELAAYFWSLVPKQKTQRPPVAIENSPKVATEPSLARTVTA